MHTIIQNDMISENVGRMVVEAPYVAEKRKAGQFIILRIDEFGERVPLTIGDADPDKGTITLFYQVVGKSTRHLSMLKAGGSIKDIAGPLGHPTEIKKYGTVACVGGGIGVAPLYPIVSAMKQAGNRVVVIIGARNKDLLILEKELGAVADELTACTDDGSYGKKAFVTEALSEVQAREKIDLVVAIGPVPMMRAVSNQTKKEGIKTMVSLNSIMIDGTGMCGGCRVTVGGERRFTCVDGPEFDGHLVDFDELMSRLGTYKSDEAVSAEKYDHACRLKGVFNER
ncbi:MAG TPA: sulfide/dihydroorotate dehydrogenase-like FAD/NAD-binding protein [Spirochaetota bacterium]|nr:sulfide/dihydroorotate dehydrogenase-like FAD/NAD-binding protein [Spirochaetota bacterium]HPI88449.1 sulfide/dihydroorotate dehydrogenase-like FAD/NAD-binding protein [Spirochaetota bacterium]HPR48812.1 sulfide/dihydroorotate dehydrogenase-like FAD/NAD-binding protein [Spirochaetota bacterium]